jgi:hypothetical protein
MADDTDASLEINDTISVSCTVGNTSRRRFRASSVSVGRNKIRGALVSPRYEPGSDQYPYKVRDWRSETMLKIAIEGQSPEGLDSSLMVRLSYNDAVALAQQLVVLTQQCGVDMCNAAAQDLADLRNTLDP